MPVHREAVWSAAGDDQEPPAHISENQCSLGARRGWGQVGRPGIPRGRLGVPALLPTTLDAGEWHLLKTLKGLSEWRASG